MHGEKSETYSNNIAHIKILCAKIKDGQRIVKTQSYSDLQTFFHTQTFTTEELLNIFSETHMHFLNGLRDKSDLVREKSCDFICDFIINICPKNDFYLSYVFPVLVERVGSPELIEECEEIRLKMVNFLKCIIEKYFEHEQLKPFYQDCITILCETLKDRSASIQIASCEVVILLSKALPKSFHLQAESLLKPTLKCFTHRNSKVRVKAVEATGKIIMHSTFRGVDEAIGPMAERLFDQVPLVRETVARVASCWLLKHRDRYSYFQKMIPLLITGLNDEVESTRLLVANLWNKVGDKFLKENEEDLKDQLNFLNEIPKNYPKHVDRPNLGCRVLVQRNISKLTQAISNELSSWQEDVRVRCAQLLCTLVLHAEESITMHLQAILPSMYGAARDDDKRVVDNIIQTGKYISTFVKYDCWGPLILPLLEDGPHFGHIKLLAALIEGSPLEDFDTYCEPLSVVLAEDFICCSRNKNYQLALTDCQETMWQKIKALGVEEEVEIIDKLKNCSLKSEEEKLCIIECNMFKIATSLIALKHIENDDRINVQLYHDLFSQRKMMFLSVKLLNHINRSPQLWTLANDDFCIFLSLLENTFYGIGPNLAIINEILINALNIEADVEMRLKIFFILATRFGAPDFLKSSEQNDEFNSMSIESFFERLINDVFVPSLVWHAGNKAQTIRTMAVTCLTFALTPINDKKVFHSGPMLLQLVTKLLPLLLSLLEDAAQKSRQMAVECIIVVKKLCVSLSIWNLEMFLQIYPEIFKRLDDPTETVRISAFHGIKQLFYYLPKEFLEPNFQAQRELIIDTLMTHLDSHEEKDQKLALDVLMIASAMNISEMRNKIEIHRPLLRNKCDCDKLLNRLNELEEHEDLYESVFSKV
ncbi:hypothetical protein ABEB36_008787 [Hypothenemus hampei]|uniref:TOG domain-containing protein n=1 Tax=Hypothenemus hampei TaxID=57062 RepID=A0ABD1EN26_HYPHA